MSRLWRETTIGSSWKVVANVPLLPHARGWGPGSHYPVAVRKWYWLPKALLSSQLWAFWHQLVFWVCEQLSTSFKPGMLVQFLCEASVRNQSTVRTLPGRNKLRCSRLTSRPFIILVLAGSVSCMRARLLSERSGRRLVFSVRSSSRKPSIPNQRLYIHPV